MPKYRRDHNWSSGTPVLFGKSRHAPPAREYSCTHGLAQVIRLIFSPKKYRVHQAFQTIKAAEPEIFGNAELSDSNDVAG